eukprot:IDg12513t1
MSLERTLVFYREPECFLFEDKATGAFARLLADDLLLTSASLVLLYTVLEKLKQKWKVEEQVPVPQKMNVSINRTESGITRTIRKHIEQLIALFSLENSKFR